MPNIDLAQLVTAEDKAAAAAASLRSSVVSAIDAHVEATARSRDYNSAESLAGYASSTVSAWAAEANAFIAWRDAVWQAAFAILSDVQAGARTAPTPAEAVAEMPVIAWPG
jgi:hypothetical protein